MLAELAHAVRSGSVDPAALVAESLRRIEAARDLNAVTAVYADDALAAARTHDRRGPLAGLPVLVKDMARVAGKVTTMGSLLFADAPPDAVDDVAVARLRAAGAIVIGRTNAPEFGATATTVNRLFGATCNPWNPAMTPGGSSGGSSAALAAGLAPLATTSDGGGSVRAPASLCGLVGYKPTMGAIGRNILPRWIGFSAQGATGASVADVVLEASVTIGPARGDFLSLAPGSIDLSPVRPTRILACRTFRADVDPEIETAFEASLEALAADGTIVERVDAPWPASAVMTWFTISTAELAESLRGLEAREDDMCDYVLQQVRFGRRVTAADYIAAQRERHRLSAVLDDLLGADAVLVTPTINTRAWPAEGPMPTAAGAVLDDPSICLNTPELNATGHPAVSAPCGLDANGVPCGMQIIAPRFADALALGTAQHLEEIRPWPATAPGYEQFGL